MGGISLGRRATAALAAVAAALALAAPAAAAPVSQDFRFTASDGVALQVTVRGESPLAPRPAIVEFSPYGNNSATADAGPAFNHVLVQIRGTGSSNGSFDALGPRTQADVAEVLQWACAQPWSNGTLGLNGFSASAITIYNSLHQPLPCVKAMVLKSGTHELYRDLIWPGGVSNLIPAAGVMALIGAPALAQSIDRLQLDPVSGVGVLTGLLGSGLQGLLHPTLDDWWRQRGFRGNANHLPTLVIDGFWDVESRGAFQGFQELRGDGARLLVIGAHDGAPAGTDAGIGEIRAWFDHFLRGVANGADTDTRVKLWLADGDREDLLHGQYVRRDASDWPVPGTQWRALHLSSARAGGGRSINDGSLTSTAPWLATKQLYPAAPSLPTATDPPNTGIIGGFGVNAMADMLPTLTEMTLAEPLGLSYTTPPLAQPIVSAGPASLEVRLASTAPETTIWAVISDVDPSGRAHPVASGRLNSAYPDIDLARSLVVDGQVVQPYNRFDYKAPARPGTTRRYRVELWPIGNRFRAGHRIRLHIIGASAASPLGLPALNTVTVGGPEPSRLLLPVLP